MTKRENATYSCDHCEQLIEGTKAYYILQHQRKTPGRKGYCSKQCGHLSQRVPKTKLTCLVCKKEFERFPKSVKSENSFCSRSCAVRYNNQGKCRNVEGKNGEGSYGLKRKYLCISCGKETRNKKYCSLKCQQYYQRFKAIDNWKNGKWNGSRGDGQISTIIRRYLFEKYDSKCCECGWDTVNPKTNTVILDVDHINGNSEDNREENLRLVCPNCHSISPFYKALNRGNGRHSRMKRYNEGKSY